MTNVEKLTEIGIIGDVRQRYGAEPRKQNKVN
jgi:hypothetical protein